MPHVQRVMVDYPGSSLYKPTYHQEKESSQRLENALQSKESIYET